MITCLAQGDSCGKGLGECSQTNGPCMCYNSEFEDVGDFKRSTGCAVHVPTLKALWGVVIFVVSINVLLGFASLLWMKRKRQRTERSEMIITCCMILVSIFTLILAAFEITGSTPDELTYRRVGVDPSTSIAFALYNIMGYASLLVKPVSQSEVSIARFAWQRTSRSLATKYHKSLIVLFALLLTASIAVVVSAYDPSLERAMTQVYGFCQGTLMLIMSILVLYATMSILRDTRRALSHASVSGRNSLRDRVEAFSKRAQRTMFLSFSILASVSATVLTMAICDECTDYFWAVIPLLFFFGNCWVTRAHLISIAASRKMRAKLSQSQLQLIQLKRKLNEREGAMKHNNHHPEELQPQHEGEYRSSSQEVERRGLEDEQRMSQASSGELKSMMRDAMYETRFASSRQTASFVLRKDSKSSSSKSRQYHHGHGQQQSGGHPRHHHHQQQRRTTTSFSTSPSNSPNPGNSPLNAAITVDENEQHSSSFLGNFLLPPAPTSSSLPSSMGSLKRLRFPTGAGRTMVSTSKRLVSQALAAMSAVVETDNEGTVIMTNIDGIVQSMAHPKPPTTHASSGGAVGNGGNDNELSSSNPMFDPFEQQQKQFGADGGENNNTLFQVKDEDEEDQPTTDSANQN